ncbi:aldehyde dehydrogenase family protein [Phaeobacter gallaeciensis]|uniref:Aldehyde dehydrogenase family protein n=2 Tax=Roseobacteraceae TaxID=2854170 RepID=A0A366X7H7_9RHOB|nr:MULTISPECIES: aldehyde dehydrogenase family protein [Roseobacteraceae]MBT3143161.1 aldehyde dehydrogenase family protein [Falsiruegeria litorea]MBT8167666.1 aldehyde dehydrogenase family protein [Falsiruegeria litorea]RBW60955.1 aldehyde dehydrogenase family protein [Phaeobacter gallaeciensis]
MSDLKLNLIAGEWISGESEIENRNPSDLSDLVGTFAQASADQLDATLDQARVAQVEWAAYGLERKQAVLNAIGNEMMQRAEELGTLLSREEGKPLAEGKGEVFRAGQFFTYYAAECLRQLGENADSVRDGVEIDVRREPIGTVAIISPWNFPTATASWKIAPALCYGNAVVWKPANVTPASAVALAEIINRQDIPKGLFSLVMGSGGSIGQRLVESPKINAISFTGSVPVGKGIASAAIQNLTKVQMEMGSKNALAVMDDADLDLAVSLALGGAFGGSGQKCTASSRLIVHANIHDAFVEKLVAGTQAMKVGHALEAGIQMGPVVSQQQLSENLAYVDLGKTEGAELACGGARLDMPHDGFYMSPGVFLNTNNDMRINREEMFAPLTSVIKVGSYDEALATVNDTNFGLTSGIVTQSLARATHFRRNARTGVVTVNLPTAGTDYHVPFGGRGDSSYGPREQGKNAAEFYTTVKTAYISAGTPV